MKKCTGIILNLCLGIVVAFSLNSEAFAARMGGGKSFGSRPSYSMPYQKSPASSQSGFNSAKPGQQPSYAPSPAQQRNQAMRDGFRQRGGLGGLLGGLALGGLLGAMFFGGGFEHINFLDLLVLGGIAFLLFRLLAARRRNAEAVYGSGSSAYYRGNAGEDNDSGNYQRQSYDQSNGAGFDTDILSRKSGNASTGKQAYPADFDAGLFLNGAKSAYAMMQRAWDNGDLAELRALSTDKVFGELQDQFKLRGSEPNRTELLNVDAEILEIRDIGTDREVAVLFDVLMRENAGLNPVQVQEVWHFTRSRNSRQPTWFLDGIQQVEV